MGVTEQKTATINALQTEVNNATVAQAQAQATADSLASKVKNFETILTAAKTQQATALTNAQLGGTAGSSTDTLLTSALQSWENAKLTLTESKGMVEDAYRTVEALIVAANEVTNLAVFIDQRKASNPLISDDLVADVATAQENADVAVAQAITAVQASFTAEGFSEQAVNSTEVTKNDAEILENQIAGAPDDSVDLPLIQELNDEYDRTTLVVLEAENAAQAANKENAEAQAELSMANDRLAAANASLAAAEAQVATV